MIPENATLFSIFLLGKGIHEKTPCDVTACRREYLRTAPGSEECLDRLGSPWSANVFGVLPAAGELSAIESAVCLLVVSHLLTVRVAKYQSSELSLPVNCCLFTLVICARTIVFCTCATCFPAYL
ncbi:hypothetical protein AVEN_81902-1 [Araneus ventricosus]|uniref:Uncharacterized protein n=1 Tax=Araneus ventricosus TaxID=182803 RepID=A0A4Y2I3U5_ARAVE|nr:hypothetical protein AVEN_81902-1 [Araneus ventricosus]